MKIQNVTIKNFRGLKNFSINFSNQTIIVGNNNTCKTTILEALNLVLSPNFYYGPGLLSEYDFFEKKFTNDENQIRIDICFNDLTEEELDYFGDHVEPIDQSGNIIDYETDTKVFDIYEKVLRIFFISEFIDDDIQCGVHYTRCLENSKVTKADRRKIGFHYFNLNRSLSKTFSLNGYSTMQRILLEKEIDIRPQQLKILNQFPEISNTFLENNEFKMLLEVLENEFGNFAFLAESTENTTNIKYEISDLSFSDINRNIQMFVRSDTSKYQLPISRQGSGTQNSLVLALLVYLNKLQGNTIVAIDEPELSLHPHAQRYLVGRLKDAGFQIIISTHSPAIAESFELSKARLIKFLDGDFQCFEISSDVISTISQKSFQILKRDLVQAFYSKAILLVEGDTEEGSFLGFNSLLRENNKGLDLDKQEITIFNIEGPTGIAHILDAIRPLPVFKILYLDNDCSEEFYKSLIDKVDLLIRSPKTPAGNDFEGMISWQSPLEILNSIISMQSQDKKQNLRLSKALKRIIWNNQQESSTNIYFDQILGYKEDSSFLTTVISLLNKWEEEKPAEKYIVRGIISDLLREMKGFRYAYEWTSCYEFASIPKGIIQLFEKINSILSNSNENFEKNYVLD